ncbi:hypothetical protein C8J56DRAFT_936476 [Mycena floridula]|nr:hypothetical protein C8J56DRAFT_936476 [Mycena floridula]
MNSKKWGNKVEKIKQDVGAAERRDFDEELEARTVSIHPSRWGKSKAEVAAMNSKKWGNKVEKIKQDVGAAERRDLEALDARDIDDQLEARTFSLHPTRWGKSKAEVAAMNSKKWGNKVEKIKQDVGAAERRDFDEELEARDFDEELEARDFDEELEARDFDEELEARDFDEELEARTVSLHPSRWGKSKAEVAVSQKKKWDKKLSKAQGGATGESAPPAAAERRSIDEDFEELLSRDLYELEDLD